MEIAEEKNIASDIKTMAEKKDVEKDSGIEESLGNSPDSETLQQKEDSDSDEDFCVRSHQRQSRIIDDDDDDDEEDNNRLIMDFIPEAAAPKDDAPFVLVEKEEEESEDEDSLFIIKRKKKNSQNSSKSLQDTGDDFSRKDLLLDSDIFDSKGTDSDSDSPSKGNGDSDSDTPFKNGFDSKSNSPSKDVNTEDNQSDEKETDDEGINTDNLSAKLKALLKKGASKKPKKLKARASKTIAEEKLQLHSETQRIIRDSKVLIPYHQPESKSLDDFLNRAMRKQQQYRALKVKCLDERKKVEFVQDTITHDSTLFKRASSESATQNSQTPSSQVVDNPDAPSQSGAVEPLNSINGDAAIVIGDAEAASNDLLTENSSPEGESKDLEKSSLKIDDDDKDDDDDELPDLIISEEPACEVDSTQEKNVVDLELVQEVPESHAVEESSEDALEKDMEVDNPSEWVIDENGLLKTDDPLMDQLVASDFKGENSQETHGGASLDVVQEQKETEQVNKTEENDKKTKLSVSELLSPELKNMKPKLSGSWDQPIFFDEEQNKESKKPAGLDKLMQRFFEHAKCPKEQKTSKVNIKIVQKEKTSENKEELTLNTITYQSEEPEELKLKSDKPGAKLLLLKDKLQQQMRVKRESARQKRCEIFNLDNEDGYQAEEEEEEAELTDGSDTDVSEDDLIENDLGENYGKEKRLHNAFADEEAEEDENEEDEDENDEDEDADDDYDKASDEDAEDDDEGEKKSNPLSKEKKNDDKKVEILFDASLHSQDNSDSDSIIPESQQRVRIRKIVKNLILSDEESQDASTQYKDEKLAGDPFQKTDFSGTFASTNNNEELKTPSAAPFIQPLSMPIEDSQDLYKSSSDFQSPEMISHNMSFPLEFQASPMFDEQGFLRVKTLTKTVNQPKISALSELCDENDENTDDILGLCSGRFTGTQDNRLKSCRNLFSDSQPESQFPASGSFPLISCDNEKKTNEADEETEEFPSLKLVSDDEDEDTRKKDSSSENDENDDSEAEGISDDGEKEGRRQVFRNFKIKSSGKIRREFVDEEAELSGSEYDSDEDDNLNDEYDIMEEEEGDNDVNLTEEQLRNQVGRVHLKNMMDEDKREVMRLQEMYLPDGDLFSEGNGRMRRFRWKNLDDNSQQDMFNTESETEEKEEEEPDELKWRIERYEREKWLKEQEVNEKKTEEESSFLKFGRIFLKKKGMSIPDPTKKVTPNEKEPLKQNKINIIQTFKKGSFLSRSNDTLAKIAEMTKPVSNQTVTTKTNGRNFVFSVVTPDDTETPKATGLQKTKSESKSCQPAKKRKIEPVKRTLSEASIFRHIDKSFS